MKSNRPNAGVAMQPAPAREPLQPSTFNLQPYLAAFTLTELMVTISIMAILAGFMVPGLKSIARQRNIHAVRAEMEYLQTALENYKVKYGAYPPGNTHYAAGNPNNVLLNQLYYELSGTTNNNTTYVTQDQSASIPVASVGQAFGVQGFINCTQPGGVDDGINAKNFLKSLSSKQIFSFVTNNNIPTTIIGTSVGGPDDTYTPVPYYSGVNPFRYLYPGTNNPGGYDLWIQLVISGKTNLICNWNRQVQINNPLP